jgi:hypothetical protein
MSDFIEELRLAFDNLANTRCWGIAVGGLAPSVVSLCMGKKIKRQIQIKNPVLPLDQQMYDGEIALLVDCSWRLDSTNGVICSWIEANRAPVSVASTLEILRDKMIESVDLSLPGMDICINFSGSLVFRVFCDRMSSDEDSDNYILYTPKWNYIVGVGSQLTREPRHLY